ncbi:helix-turn-helix domain-containing protein [Methylocystis sp. JAN1]|uniref:helix-turn-helix domain-containing protein n=1 Tax=Methylocystis sp. JAN1 TaxID=3397211 RepID=UPI003FA2B5B0
MTAPDRIDFATPEAGVSIRPAVLTIKQAMAYAQIGRTKLFELIKLGELDARRLGTKVVIFTSSLDAYLSALPPARVAAKEDADK